ncbi:MAG: tetratricopeptide repeat protein [Candidatus Sulfotelmatobacter sp.]
MVHAGRYSEAEKLERETLDIQRRVLGPEHSLTLHSMTNLALALEHQGRIPEAEQEFREELEIPRRVFGPEHSLTLLTLQLDAGALSREGRYEDALRCRRPPPMICFLILPTPEGGGF